MQAIAFAISRTLLNTRIESGEIFRLWFAEIERSARTAFWRLEWKLYPAAKRALDASVAGTLLIALSPLFAIVAVWIRLTDPGRVFYSQTRVGYEGRLFRMYKFRSMYSDADARKAQLQEGFEQNGKRFKLKNDPRITPVGRIIRKYSIDELPQLWNVLRGDMSLVGPRPSIPSEVRLYTPQERRRLLAIPGLTCIWQVSGRNNIDFAGQVELDVEYIYHRGFLLDISLLFRTIPAVLTARGAC